MVPETVDANEARGKRVVHLHVLPLPSDPTKVAGVVKMDDPNPKHAISFHRSTVMEFKVARKLAHKIANERRADRILIVDPKNLLRKAQTIRA